MKYIRKNWAIQAALVAVLTIVGTPSFASNTVGTMLQTMTSSFEMTFDSKAQDGQYVQSSNLTKSTIRSEGLFFDVKMDTTKNVEEIRFPGGGFEGTQQLINRSTQAGLDR